MSRIEDAFKMQRSMERGEPQPTANNSKVAEILDKVKVFRYNAEHGPHHISDELADLFVLADYIKEHTMTPEQAREVLKIPKYSGEIEAVYIQVCSETEYILGIDHANAEQLIALAALMDQKRELK